MSFTLNCMLFGILVFCPETDAGELTWKEPFPIQTVPDNNNTDHFSKKELREGKTNATMSWRFTLTDLGFHALTISFGGQIIAGVRSSVQGPQTGFENQYDIKWVAGQNLVTLFIFSVTTEVNGVFTCQVYAVRGFGTFLFSSNVEVDVVAPPSNIVISSGQNIKAPAELTLNCSADGKPKPTITWTRVSDDTVVYMPLNITGAKNEGSYRCTADNGVGDRLIRDVNINVLFSPKVTLAKKFFVGREQTASLICQVEGNPKPTISWSPCDLQSFLCDNEYLNISRVQTARTNYTCTASNALGVHSATTLLLIGGNNVYLRLSISGECDMKESVWGTLQNELSTVFASTQSYSGAQLIEVTCGSLIFDVALKFSIEVAEDETISIIQNAIGDGKLRKLSVKGSYINGSLPVVPSKSAMTPTSTLPNSDDHTLSIVLGASIAGVVLIVVIVGVVICWMLKKRIKSRKENTKGVTPKERIIEEYEISPGRTGFVKAEDAKESFISRPTYVNFQEVTLTSYTDSSPHNDYAPLDLKTRSWEVPREDVIVEKVIGKGAFGQVAKGTAKNLSFRSGTGNIGIKMLKENAAESDKRDLKSELELMKTLKPHPHVIKLLGCVTESGYSPGSCCS